MLQGDQNEDKFQSKSQEIAPSPARAIFETIFTASPFSVLFLFCYLITESHYPVLLVAAVINLAGAVILALVTTKA